MNVRDLEWKDFHPLTENFLALYDEIEEDPDVGISLFAKKPSLGEEAGWFTEMFRRQDAGEGVIRVADEDGRAIGLCTVLPKAKDREAPHIGVLGISIGRPWRGKGHGRALITDALARCQGKFELVELQVFATNARARALYESLGFRRWGVLPKGILRRGRYIDVDHMILDMAAFSRRATTGAARRRR